MRHWSAASCVSWLLIGAALVTGPRVSHQLADQPGLVSVALASESARTPKKSAVTLLFANASHHLKGPDEKQTNGDGRSLMGGA